MKLNSKLRPQSVVSYHNQFTIFILVSKSHARRIADTESSIAEAGMKYSASNNSLSTKLNSLRSIPNNLGRLNKTFSENELENNDCTCATCNNKYQIPPAITVPEFSVTGKDRYYRRSNSLHHPISMSTIINLEVPIPTSKSMTDLHSHQQDQSRRRGSSFGNFLLHVSVTVLILLWYFGNFFVTVIVVLL